MTKYKIRVSFIFVLVLFLVNIFFFKENNNFINFLLYLYDRAGTMQAVLYAFSILFSLFSLSLVFFQKNKILYLLSIVYVCVAYILNLVYYRINGEGFSYQDLKIILLEADKFALEAILTFQDSIYFAISIVAVMLIIFSFLRRIIVRNNLYISYKIIYPMFFLSIFGTYYILYKTANNITYFPAPLKVIDTILYYNANGIYFGKRDELKSYPINEQEFKNIIWIVDESVGGKYLSINGYKKDSTPYLKTLHNHMINLGIASSGGNTSSSSNLILQSGIQLNELPDKANYSLKKSSIFQYAKNAGYTTSYISGQSHDMKLQNYMTEYDLEFIDNFHQPTDGDVYSNELIPEEIIINQVKNALDAHKKNFIYIVKAGVHFHYESTYPSSHKIFKPTLHKNEPMSLEKKENIINSYLNGIRWNVDEFFRFFFKKTEVLDRNDTIIIYTSDHGQSILENGLRATHSTARNPPLSQGIVPFVLFLKNKKYLYDKVIQMKDHATHYMIFPTTLKWMGYDVNDTTLFDSSTGRKQGFYHGNLFGIGSGAKTTIVQKNNSY
jgi:glucan phosphoethanolaminetransferase (alkaline phosphatase superfamily)